MKKLLLVFAVVCTLAVYGRAGNIADNFKANYSASADLSAYNTDMNTLLGVADFHTGKGATFPGFDFGATFSAVKPANDALFGGDDIVFIPVVYAETAIPYINTGMVLRGTTYNGFNSTGVGFKYPFNILELVHISTSLFYDHGWTNYYKTDHYSASAVVSVSVLGITPFAGIGYDYGHLQTKSLEPARSTHDGSWRTTLGLNFSPLPLFHGYLSYTKTEHNEGFNGGVGVSF